MIRNFKNFVVKEENLTGSELKSKIRNNSTFKKMDSICNKYGYELYIAVNKEYSPTTTITSISIRSKSKDDFQPSIIFDDGWGGMAQFTIQTTSYGALELNDYEKFIKGCNNAYNVVKELSKIDFKTLYTMKEY